MVYTGAQSSLVLCSEVLVRGGGGIAVIFMIDLYECVLVHDVSDKPA